MILTMRSFTQRSSLLARSSSIQFSRWVDRHGKHYTTLAATLYGPGTSQYRAERLCIPPKRLLPAARFRTQAKRSKMGQTS
jgi:hypothetical protein